MAEDLSSWPCSSEECEEPAAYAIAFRGQAGHVHDCIGHTAVLREWTDVERVVSLPCPFPHGDRWTDTPKALVEEVGRG